MASWQWGKAVGAGNCPVNFSLSEKFLLFAKFWSKNTKFGAKNPPFWGIYGQN